METAPIPENEEARLAELGSYAILDTLPERVYDDFIHIASLICNTPMSAISLVDRDRQWFKARDGLAVSETSRDIAFCAHAILNPGEVMEVTDALEDRRFTDNPLVLDDPHIRFYAGAPLVSETGETLGTLCVMDRIQRQLQPEQRNALQALAHQIADQLTLRREVSRLEEALLAQERLAMGTDRRQRILEETAPGLRKQAATDGLTQLWDRSALQHCLEEEFQRARNRPTGTVSILIVDVDGFKSYNDAFGHPASDQVLTTIAQLLREQLRHSDIIARYGENEFAAILADTGADGAIVLAERVRRAVQRASWPLRPVTVSIGAATMERKDNSAGQVLERADTELLAAKQQGRNRAWNGIRRRVYDELLADMRLGRTGI